MKRRGRHRPTRATAALLVAVPILFAAAAQIPPPEDPAENSPTDQPPSQRITDDAPPPGDEPAHPDDAAMRGDLSTLNRLVRHFDFEERDTRGYAESIPRHFYRYEEPDEGFAVFGRMALTEDRAASGDWSFGFEVDGASMAARLPTGILPVVPNGDYLVTVRVRTEGLEHARARISSILHDGHGDPLEHTRVDSRLVNTADEWEELSILVYGEAEDATDLVISLEVLQPRQYVDRRGQLPGPQFDDVDGRVWFDDLMVWQLPRIELTTPAPGNVIVEPEKPTLVAVVRDMTVEQLTGKLRVFDIDGNIVYDETFDPNSIQGERPFVLPLDMFGWYRAVMELHNPDRLIGRRWLDLTYLPAPRRDVTRARPRLTALLGPQTNDELRRTTNVIRRLGAGGVILPMWDRTVRRDTLDERYTVLRDMLDDLLDRRLHITAALLQLPPELVDATNVRDDDLLGGLDNISGPWQRQLQDLFINFGQQIPRWQIGDMGYAAFIEQIGVDQAHRRAADALSRLVLHPSVMLPWNAELPVIPPPGGSEIHLSIPAHAGPAGAGQFVREWTDAGAPFAAYLQTAPGDRLSERQQVLDLVMRTLHVWREGVDEITIDAPWIWAGDPRRQIMPTAFFAVWRTLSEQLGNRRFVGELDLGEGLRCWMLAGDSPRNAALVAWNESAPADRAVVDILLARRPVQVCGLFGNRSEIAPSDGRHRIELSDEPIFIEDIDLNIAQFRAGFRVEPPFIASEARLHEHAVVLTNPWPSSITGTLRLREPDRWQVTPRAHSFTIQPGESVELPFDIVLERNAEAGPRRLDAEVDLNADGRMRFDIHTDVAVGLEDVTFTASTSVAPNHRTGELDLVVVAFVTNNTDRPVNFDSFVIGPDLPQMRRPIPALEPGRSTMRTYRIEGGARRLADREIRVGITQTDGPARLNRRLVIPPRPDAE